MAAILDFRSEHCSYFWSTSQPNASYQVSSHLIFWFRRSEKIDFQDGSYFGFPIRTNLGISDLLVTLMLSTKFQVDWPFGSGEEEKKRFSRWLPYLGFSIRKILTIFYLQVTLMLPTKFQVNWPSVQEKKQTKKVFKMTAILDFLSEWI